MTSKDLFHYNLPERLIAQRPKEQRDKSRLMILDKNRKTVTHTSFSAFPDYLRKGDVLVINKTKVFPARLHGARKSGGKVEILLVKRKGPGLWEAMTRGMKKVAAGDMVTVGNAEVTLVEKNENGLALVKFENDDSVQSLTDQFGEVPLPPYIHRTDGKTDERDRERYQTVFAEAPGSCAAPTAGLHFTDSTLDQIRRKGVVIAPLTLHVGPGTFRPVKTEDIEDHVMDFEPFEIPDDTATAINKAKNDGRRVIAVGSTVTRALESSADDIGVVRQGLGSTDLFITPGYRFKTPDAILTNFHLPESTLLMLVSAFAGREFILEAYDEAVKEGYHFFSYGDVMLIK